MQLEDVLSWQCGHPQVRSMQTASASKEAGEASGDLQLDVLSNLERHVDRLSAFSDEEDEAELHNLYMVRAQHKITAQHVAHSCDWHNVQLHHGILRGMLSMCARAQDANGDSDLWDLAITEAGEAVRHPTSTSPFASKALLTCFNSDVRHRSPISPSACAVLLASAVHNLS